MEDINRDIGVLFQFLHGYHGFLKRINIIILCIPLFIAISLLLAKIWPWGADFYFTFHPLASQWLNGQREMYGGTGVRLFYPPWSLFVIIPLGLLPIEVTHGFLLIGTFVLIAIAIRTYQGSKTIPIFIILMSLANLHSFDLYIRGQIDAVILLGIVLGLWAIKNRKPLWLSLSFCLMLMKPPLNVLLVIVLYLISIRDWNRRELAIVISLPFIMVLISSFLVGLNWPIEFIQNVELPIDYLNISIWRGAKWLGVPYWPIAILALLVIFYSFSFTWKERASERTLSIILATTFIFTLYANGDHYILLIPAFLFVIQNHLLLGILAYAATWTPLLRLVWGSVASPIDIIFPIILLFSSYVIIRRGKGSALEGG